MSPRSRRPHQDLCLLKLNRIQVLSAGKGLVMKKLLRLSQGNCQNVLNGHLSAPPRCKVNSHRPPHLYVHMDFLVSKGLQADVSRRKLSCAGPLRPISALGDFAYWSCKLVEQEHTITHTHISNNTHIYTHALTSNIRVCSNTLTHASTHPSFKPIRSKQRVQSHSCQQNTS